MIESRTLETLKSLPCGVNEMLGHKGTNKYFQVVHWLTVLIVLLGACSWGSDGDSRTSELESQEPSLVYMISPEGMAPEEWYEEILGKPVEFGGPLSPFVQVNRVSYPSNAKKGQWIELTVETIPNAILDMTFDYQVAGGRPRVEVQENIQASEEGIASTLWLVSEDLQSIYDTELVFVRIDAYPSGYYSAPNVRLGMLPAAHYSFAFTVDTR